jgi:hypothetical protein
MTTRPSRRHTTCDGITSPVTSGNTACDGCDTPPLSRHNGPKHPPKPPDPRAPANPSHPATDQVVTKTDPGTPQPHDVRQEDREQGDVAAWISRFLARLESDGFFTEEKAEDIRRILE